MPDVIVEIADSEFLMLGSQGTATGSTFTIVTPQLLTGQHRLMARATDIAGNHSAPSMPVDVLITNGMAAPLSARPAHGMVAPGGTIHFLAVGGLPTYSWVPVSLISGGSISPSGHYAAGTTKGTDVIRLIDSNGASLDVMIDVGP